MREIKFRAWHKERNKMLDVFGVNFRTPATVQVLNDKYELYEELLSGVSLVQFTGLKDCNGVDIYEGDIVVDHVGVGVVEYSEIKAAFKVNYKDGFAKWFIDYTLKGEKESLKVIGNICQNSDLLGVKA